jgi:hypothetical protein
MNFLPNVEDPVLKKQRENVIQAMKQSRDIDMGKYISSPTIRCYRMTKSEYDHAAKYTFSIYLEAFPETGKITEGYCYDFRTLMRQKFIGLNFAKNYIPLTMTKKRWDYIMENFTIDKELIAWEGVLKFPLYQIEINNILKMLKKFPVLCSTMEGCIADDQDDDATIPGLVMLFDESIEKRFGYSVDESKEIVNAPLSFKIEKVPNNDNVDSVLEWTRRELEELNMSNVPAVVKKLKDEAFRKEIGKLIEEEKTPSQVRSIVLDESLNVILNSRK